MRSYAELNGRKISFKEINNKNVIFQCKNTNKKFYFNHLKLDIALSCSGISSRNDVSEVTEALTSLILIRYPEHLENLTLYINSKGLDLFK